MQWRLKDSTIVIQTEINNVINTYQDDEDIVNQVTVMIQEACERLPHNRVIYTSIIPTDIGGERTAVRIRRLNSKLCQAVTGAGAIYVDLQSYFTVTSKDRHKEPRLNKHLYVQEGTNYLHLNRSGNTVLSNIVYAEICRVEYTNSHTRVTPYTMLKGRESFFHLERTRYRKRQM